MPMTMPGPSALKPARLGNESLQERRHEQQREVAVDDRRHAGEDLEDRLDARGGRWVVRTRSGRWRSAAPSAAPPPSRSSTPAPCRRRAAARRSAGIGEQRRPLGADQELDDRHLAEERDRLDREHDDDADGRADREQRAQEQRPLDERLESRSHQRSTARAPSSRSCSSVMPTCEPPSPNARTRPCVVKCSRPARRSAASSST